ncbi:MAG: Fumarylacetoacetate hydrolase family protein [Mucilaginibacter sp.]|nr:Fumarylacetoacetate hydrolase family protein [Mucilaginibacter sp.]
MKLYHTTKGNLLEHEGSILLIDEHWDSLINRDNLEAYLLAKINGARLISAEERSSWLNDETILAPIGQQEVWAAGVTYLKSRDARKEESQSSGGASLYEMVYDADRPELFFKATPQRVSGHGQQVYIRKDSTWNVPEPELTLFISSSGVIQGYTIGNDMSSRSIEGENALYLPQAKIYEKCAGLGPCIYVTSSPIAKETTIKMIIKRDDKDVYNDIVAVSRIKRSFTELVGYLFRECDFPNGCFLMTGTCLVPPVDFTLQEKDVVEINIDGIGTLVNTIGTNPRH